jgi:hypothetical protein
VALAALGTTQLNTSRYADRHPELVPGAGPNGFDRIRLDEVSRQSGGPGLCWAMHARSWPASLACNRPSGSKPVRSCTAALLASPKAAVFAPPVLRRSRYISEHSYGPDGPESTRRARSAPALRSSSGSRHESSCSAALRASPKAEVVTPPVSGLRRVRVQNRSSGLQAFG